MSELEVVKTKIAVAEADLAGAKDEGDKELIRNYSRLLGALQEEKNLLLQQGILFYQLHCLLFVFVNSVSVYLLFTLTMCIFFCLNNFASFCFF